MSLSQIERYAGLLGLSPSVSPGGKGNRNNTKLIEYFQNVRNDLCTVDRIPEIIQWLNISQTITTTDISFLNNLLIARTFIGGNKIGLEDIVVFDALAQNPSLFNTAISQSNVSRWIEHVSCNLNTTRIAFAKVPTLLPFISIHSFEDAVQVAQTPSEKSAPSSSDKEATTASKKSVKQEEKEKAKKSKAGKDEAATPAPAAAPVDEADPSKLDIRVGVVLNCWIHPDSEKLLCEEIDVGEEVPRRIGSGIRAFYQPEQLIGRKVFVLANLKERSLAGFPSQGMVLCAANADHTAVALIEPPASSKAGDRVTFDGYSGEPAPAAQVAKKKILEKVAPDLKTNDAGIPTWRNIVWTVGSDQCSSPMSNSQIS